MAIYFNILAWRTHGQRSLVATVQRVAKSGTRLKRGTRFSTHACTFTTSATQAALFFLEEDTFEFYRRSMKHEIHKMLGLGALCSVKVMSVRIAWQDGRNLTTLFGAKIPRFHSGFHTDTASNLLLPSSQSWPHTEA